MDESSSYASNTRVNPASGGISPLFVAFCFIAVIVFYTIQPSVADPDIWWHLRDAQIQLSSHSFLTHDLFSFTAANAAWMNHEWLGELPFYAGFHLFGIAGIYLVTLLTVEAIFLALFYLIYLEVRQITAAMAGTVFGILFATVSFGPRTLLYGWLLLIVQLLIFLFSKERERVVWALPFIYIVWVNTHGSWLIGIVLFGVFVVSNFFTFSLGCVENRAASVQQIKRLLLVWFTCVCALFLNPYGWRLVLYPFDIAYRQTLNISNVEEWKTLDFHSPRGHVMLVFLGMIFLLQLVKSRKWSLFELAASAIALYSAFSYSRFLFMAAILVCPALSRSLATILTAPRRPFSPLIAFASLIMILGCVVGRVRTLDMSATQKDERYPTKALPFLANFHPDGNVFNEYIWGGVLEWNARHIPVFVDSRADIFEYNGTLKDYLDIVHLKNSIDLLNKHAIKYVLYERDSPLTYLLKTSRDWKVDYEDKTTVLLERKGP